MEAISKIKNQKSKMAAKRRLMFDSRWQFWLAAGLLVALCGPAGAQGMTAAVLLQQSPLMGGFVTPNPGVYEVDVDSEMVLTAVALPGYDFVYWLGDVSNPTASRTTAYVDKPKIIVAVFRTSEYQLPAVGGGGGAGGGTVGSSAGGGLGGDLVASAVLFYSPSGISGGGGTVRRSSGGGSTLPVIIPIEPPVPEPASFLLLLAGGVLALRRGR